MAEHAHRDRASSVNGAVALVLLLMTLWVVSQIFLTLLTLALLGWAGFLIRRELGWLGTVRRKSSWL